MRNRPTADSANRQLLPNLTSDYAVSMVKRIGKRPVTSLCNASPANKPANTLSTGVTNLCSASAARVFRDRNLRRQHRLLQIRNRQVHSVQTARFDRFPPQASQIGGRSISRARARRRVGRYYRRHLVETIPGSPARGPLGESTRWPGLRPAARRRIFALPGPSGTS